VAKAVAAVVTGVLAALLVGPNPPKLSEATTGDGELARQVRTVLGTDDGYRGVGVALLENGKVRFAGLGSAGYDDTAKVDDHTAFEIGSIPKALTGMLLADLAQAGEVRLDQRVGDLVPGTALGNTGNATLAELASHRSGLPRLPSQPAFMARAMLANITGGNPYQGTEQDVLDWAASAGPSGRSDPSYSNFGVSVLGDALAADQRTNYPDLVTKRVLGPLGMSDTTLAVDQATPPDPRASGTSRSGRPQVPWLAPGFTPAGIGVWSTSADLARLLQRILDGDAPGIEATRARWDFGDGDRIGLGWITTNVNGRVITWHNGGTGGFRSFVGFDAAADRAVVLLSNTSAPVDGAAFELLAGRAP
jgi:CubicO group peptidase (beta-lactamase class C family)